MSDSFCPFVYKTVKSQLEVLCPWALLQGDWVSHFLESPQVLIAVIFFPLGLLVFPEENSLLYSLQGQCQAT